MKKIIKNSIFTLLLLFTSIILSACCSPRICEINVIFKDADENLQLENYTEYVKLGTGMTVEISLPEGYVYDNFSAKVGDIELKYEVVSSDNSVEEKFQYTVPKKIIVNINKLNNDHDLILDMSGCKYKKLPITVAEDILKNSVTSNYHGDQFSNLKAVVINPDYLSNLKELSGDAIIEEVDFSSTGVAWVDYGSNVIFCHIKDANYDDMYSLYSPVGKFTTKTDRIEHNKVEYIKLNASLRGNLFYNLYEGNAPIVNSRLYYLGLIKEEMHLYRNIPNFDNEKGVSFEDKENQFIIITNKQEHNSDLISINMYAPTTETFDLEKEYLDQVEINSTDNLTISRIDKYDEEDKLKNPSVLSEYGKRYDKYSMYIGNNIAFDPMLDDEERSSLSSELYLVISSNDGIVLEDIEVNLLSYEKQKTNDYPLIRLNDYYFKTTRNQLVFKINKEMLEEFFYDRTSENGIQYIIGSAYLHVTFNNDFLVEHSDDSEFTTLVVPLELNGKTIGYDNDYLVEIFVENEQGIDYGFIDRHSFHEDIIFFKTSQLYDWDGTNFVARTDLYVSVEGPKYNDYYSPVINNIYMYKAAANLPFFGDRGIVIENPKELNGYHKQNINITVDSGSVNNSTYAGKQLRIRVNLIITVKNDAILDLDFTNIEFKDEYADAIYMTNSIEFDSMDTFQRVDYMNVNSEEDYLNLNFGANTEIYYFVYSEDEELEFDVYVGQKNPLNGVFEAVYDETRLISQTKQLLDILGNAVRVRDNAGNWHNVLVKYQYYDVYLLSGNTHFAFNPNAQLSSD